MLRLPACVAVLALLCTPSLTAQDRELRIDFGGTAYPTGNAGGVQWNDMEPGIAGVPLPLLDTTGAASGVTLTFTGQPFDGTNNAGTTSPTPGSPLDLLGWPASALRDTMYGSGSTPIAQFTLSGLDPTATHDLTFVASRLGVSDQRVTTYTVFGAYTVSATLDASNNTTDLVQVRGLAPDAGGSLVVEVSPDPTNTNSSQFFYLNALGVDEYAAGTQPPLVAFLDGRLDFSRVQGHGPFSTGVSLYTNDGTAPVVSLTAIDDVTGLPPTWLSVPAMATVGAPFTVTVDDASVPVGTVSATVTAQAGGYDAGAARMSLRVRPVGGALNLLYYGNSYSIVNNVPALVAAIAGDAGLPVPFTVPRLVGGQDLDFHLNDPNQAAAITDALPLGEAWDFVVLQGFSTEATSRLGDPQGFIDDAEAIVANVRAHSPMARATMYQTWARAQGYPWYTGNPPIFDGPPDMHRQIESSYIAAVANLDAVFGAGTGRRAAAGETVALRNWDAALYDPDGSHPGPEISVMAAMSIFTALYEVNACDVAPDFGGGSDLANRLGGFGFGLADWQRLAGYADRVAVPSQRRYPGSGGDLILATGVNAAADLCPEKDVAMGDTVTLQVQSPVGRYELRPLFVYVDVFPTGFPPGPFAPYPEVQYDPTRAVRLYFRGALPAGGVTLSGAMPVSLSGYSLLFQALSLGPSPKTGNMTFTTTDGKELRFP